MHLRDSKSSGSVDDAIRATAEDTEEDVRDMEDDEAVTRRALELLDSRHNDRYEAALVALREDTRDWWVDVLARDPSELDEGEQPATPDEAGLRRFLEDEVLPWFEARKQELASRPLVREQAFGEALDPDKLERLGRYEVHLDRKLERMLSMTAAAQGPAAGDRGWLIRLAKIRPAPPGRCCVACHTRETAGPSAGVRPGLNSAPK